MCRMDPGVRQSTVMEANHEMAREEPCGVGQSSRKASMVYWVCASELQLVLRLSHCQLHCKAHHLFTSKSRHEQVLNTQMWTKHPVSRNKPYFQVKMYKTHQVRTTFGSWDFEKVHAVVARSTFPSVKMYKTHQVRTTFGSWDVEKVHAVVARSTFPSQNVQNTPGSDHNWQLRFWKSARRCGAKHISKSRCTKHTRFGPLLAVEMLKKCTPLWHEAHFQVKMLKTPGVRTTFGGSDVEKVHAVLARSTFPSQNVQKHTRFGPLLAVEMLKKCTPLCCEAHFEVKMLKTPGVRTTFGGSDVALLHYITLHYTTLHYTALEDITHITLHYTTLHYTTLHYTTLSSTTLHYLTLHYIPLHYNYNYTTTQLHSTTLHYTKLHYTTLHYTTLHSLHYTTLHWITLHHR